MIIVTDQEFRLCAIDSFLYIISKRGDPICTYTPRALDVIQDSRSYHYHYLLCRIPETQTHIQEHLLQMGTLALVRCVCWAIPIACWLSWHLSEWGISCSVFSRNLIRCITLRRWGTYPWNIWLLEEYTPNSHLPKSDLVNQHWAQPRSSHDRFWCVQGEGEV